MSFISRRFGIWWPVAALLLIGVGVASTLFYAQHAADSNARAERQNFIATSERVASALKVATQRDEDLIVSAETLLIGNPRTSNSAFRHWTQITHLFERHPEVNVIGYTAPVPASQLAAFIAEKQADPPGPLGPGGSYVVTPPGHRALYCLIGSTITRADTPVLSVTLDRCAETLGSQVHLAARDSGQPAYTPLKAGGATVLAIITPVYTGGAVPTTVTARRKAFLDWSGVVVSPAALLTSALVGHAGIAVTLRYRNKLSDVSFSAGHARSNGQRQTIAIGNGWTIAISGAAVPAGLLSRGNGILVLAVGILLSGLLGVLLLVLGTGRSRAMRIVAEKTGELNHLALHDALTGLPNRVLVMDRAEQMLARAQRAPTGVAALFVDIDGFKQINDSFGHAAGDTVLRTVSERMMQVARAQDTLGRLGGDEFVVLVESSTADGAATMVAERLIDVLRQPIELNHGGRSVAVSASIGIAASRTGSADDLLRDADLALYAAKHAGKDRCIVFEPAMQADAQDRYQLKVDLHTALDHGQFFLLYQPIFALSDRHLSGVEALIRWQHPTRGIIEPNEFIPLAEEAGLSVAIGRWVLRQACSQVASWRRAGHRVGLSVNLSSVQLGQPGFKDDVRNALADYGLDAGDLTIEIAETALLGDLPATLEHLKALKALGVRIAIDGFGSTCRSLASLPGLPIDVLKIDGSISAGGADSGQSQAIVQTLVQLGRALKIQTFAEIVQEPEELDRFDQEGAEQVQGFELGRPLDAGAIEGLLDGTV